MIICQLMNPSPTPKYCDTSQSKVQETSQYPPIAKDLQYVKCKDEISQIGLMRRLEDGPNYRIRDPIYIYIYKKRQAREFQDSLKVISQWKVYEIH